MKKLFFLNQYRKEVELVSFSKKGSMEKKLIPSQWLEIVIEEAKNIRIKKL